jgi:hypothetical protein
MSDKPILECLCERLYRFTAQLIQAGGKVKSDRGELLFTCKCGAAWTEEYLLRDRDCGALDILPPSPMEPRK